LNRTQSAIRMQIRRLEEMLGERLIADRKRVTLTPAGERVIEHARRIMSLNDELLVRARGEDVSGRVRIGAPDDYVSFFMPAMLRKLAISHPHIEVEVRCNMSMDLIAAVDQGQLDLALVTRLRGFEAGTTVRREPLIWVASDEALAARRPLPLALFSPGCPFREAALELLDKYGLPFRIAYESPSLATLTAAVSEGLAIAALAQISLSPGMIVLDTAHGLPPLPVVEMVLYGPQQGGSRAAQAVKNSVMGALAGRFDA
ncbi:MAG: LysR substrate-binding domain-containing protein, partial [Alphaproteobacteria bacterium]